MPSALYGPFLSGSPDENAEEEVDREVGRRYDDIRKCLKETAMGMDPEYLFDCRKCSFGV